MKMNHHPSVAGSPRAFLTLLFGAGLVLGQPCAGDPGAFSNTGSLATARNYHTAPLPPTQNEKEFPCFGTLSGRRVREMSA